MNIANFCILLYKFRASLQRVVISFSKYLLSCYVTYLGKLSIKSGYLTVRLTVRVDPPPYGQLFCDFFEGCI